MISIGNGTVSLGFEVAVHRAYPEGTHGRERSCRGASARKPHVECVARGVSRLSGTPREGGYTTSVDPAGQLLSIHDHVRGCITVLPIYQCNLPIRMTGDAQPRLTSNVQYIQLHVV